MNEQQLQQLQQLAQEIITLSDSNPQAADQKAMEAGYALADMFAETMDQMQSGDDGRNMEVPDDFESGQQQFI